MSIQGIVTCEEYSRQSALDEATLEDFLLSQIPNSNVKRITFVCQETIFFLNVMGFLLLKLYHC